MPFAQIRSTNFSSLLNELGAQPTVQIPFRHGDPEDAPQAGTVWACWNEEATRGDSLPALLIIRDEEIEDFFAWAGSFLPSFRPLTSFIRVLPWSHYLIARRSRQRPIEAPMSALVGLILGEALLNSTGRGFLTTLPITAFETTYFAALGQAIISGLPREGFQFVEMGWHLARELTGQPERRIPPESLSTVGAVLLRLMGYDKWERSFPDEADSAMLEEACREVQNTGSISSFLWHKLSGGQISSSSFADSMRASKELRVETFERASRLLLSEVRSSLTAGFLVGYLASQVSDGSLQHAHLIAPVQEQLPTAMLWYGICAGLHPENRVQVDYDYLGLRIQRALCKTDSVLTPPSCDISVHELTVLSRANQRFRAFRQAQASFLRVEIAPMVTTVVKSLSRQGAAGQLNLFASSEQSAEKSDQLEAIIKTLRATLDEAERILGKQSSENSHNQSRNKRRR